MAARAHGLPFNHGSNWLLPPTLSQTLAQDPTGDWRARESAILALGAISIGCASGLVPYLAEMVNMLLPHLADARPLVRSITCWALSRYARWIVERSAEPTGGAAQMDAVLQVPHGGLGFGGWGALFMREAALACFGV